MRSYTRFAIVGIALLMVLALALPASSGATSATCAEETSSAAGPYSLAWKVLPNLRLVHVSGTVMGTFNGTCRGFATGTVTVSVKRHHGSIEQKSVTFSNAFELEFKNGFQDTGQPLPFHFGRRFKKLVVGDCVQVEAVWDWHFQNNEPVPNSHGSVTTPSRCVRAVHA